MSPVVRHWRRGWSTLAVVSIGLASCSRADPAPAHHVEAFPELTAEVEARIGDSDDPEVGFSRIGGVDVDDQGNVYVLEALASEIRVYSPDGALLNRIGRQGGGPGEFQSGPRFGVLGDTVWAIDNRANRITLFNRSGTLLSTGTVEDVVVPLPSGFGHVLPWTMRSDGKFMGHFGRVSFPRDVPLPDVDPTDSIPVPLITFDASGAVADTIGWAGRPPPRMWRPPSEEDRRLEFVEVAGRRMIAPSPPTTSPRWLPVTDGYVSVATPLAMSEDDGVFTVTRIGLHGDTVYHRAFHYSPSRYSSEDLDSISVRAARGEPGGMAPYSPGAPPPPNWEVIAAQLRSAMDFPEFKLPLDYPWLAQDNGIWLRRPGNEETGTAKWLLLDSNGQARGELTLPVDVRIAWSRGDTFWAVDPDEYDVPWLVRYRIRPG